MTKARDIASAAPAPSTVSATEIGYLDGVSSAIQTQIDSKIGSASAINPTIVDAKGDLLVGSAADTVARLAVGTNDYVLTADSSATNGVKWAAASSGAMTVLASGNMPTGGSSPLDLQSISSSYNDLRLVMRNVTFSANTGQYVRVNNKTTGIYNNFLIVMDGSTFATSGSNTATHNSLWYNGMTPSSTVTMIIDLPDYANTTSNKIINSTSYYQKHDTTGIWQCIRNFGGIRMTEAIDRISMVNETASSVSGGTYVLYGIK